MAETVIFLVHPDTGIIYSIQEAAKMLNTTTASVYGRIRRGDTGHILWRPKGVSKEFMASESHQGTYIKCREEETYID